MFKPNTYAKNVIFIPQQLLNRPQPYLLMHLITVILITMTSFLTLLSYYLKVYLDFKKSAKQTKSISMTVQDLKIFGIDLFLNISNLSISLNFICPKIRITNLDEHTLLYLCGLFADRDVMHDLWHDLAWPLQLNKTSFDVKCGVEDFELFLFPCLWITVFDPVSPYCPYWS